MYSTLYYGTVPYYEVLRRSETAIPGDTVRYPLMDIPLMILDYIVAQDVRGLESLDSPQNPNLDLDLRRDSAPAARRPCNHLPTVPYCTHESATPP